jgi:hypothetical protein
MGSGYSGQYYFTGEDGKKEQKARAEDVQRRLMSASALTHDLDIEYNELKFWVEIDGQNFQPSDLKNVKTYLEKAYDLLQSIYFDVNEITGRPVPERLKIQEANEIVQPALRIEAKAREFRQWVAKGTEAKDKLDTPRANAADVLAMAERKRLQAESELVQARQQVWELEASRAENYPEAKAALITAEREIIAGAQMVQSGQQALLRKSFREAYDLAQRSQKILESGIGRFITIKFAIDKNRQASGDADEALDNALHRLQEVKGVIAARAKLISAMPQTYLQSATQRIGQARRAYKSNPPQFMTAFKLANEGLTLLDQALERANEEVRNLRDARIKVRELSRQLSENLAEARTLINNRQTVPVRAEDIYRKARDARERIMQDDIDNLTFVDLTKLNSQLQTVLEQTEAALELLRGF